MCVNYLQHATCNLWRVHQCRDTLWRIEFGGWRPPEISFIKWNGSSPQSNRLALPSSDYIRFLFLPFSLNFSLDGLPCKHCGSRRNTYENFVFIFHFLNIVIAYNLNYRIYFFFFHDGTLVRKYRGFRSNFFLSYLFSPIRWWIVRCSPLYLYAFLLL